MVSIRRGFSFLFTGFAIKLCYIMTTTTNAENLRQYKSRFSSIVEPIMVFASSTNLVKEVKNFYPNFKRIA